MAELRQAVQIALFLPLLICSALPQTPSSSSKSKHTVRVPVEEPQASDALSRAEAALSANDYDKAEPLLNEVVAAHPKDFRGWFDLALVYNATGRKQEAVAAYRKAVAADPGVFESNLNLGLMLAQTGDPEAEKYLRAATQLKPTARVDENLGNAWLSLGHVIEGRDSAGALAAYTEAGRLVPADAEPHLSAGALLERQDQADAALKEYQTAAQLAPRSAESRLGLANIYMKLHRLPEAEQALRQYITLEPQNAAAQLQLGRVLQAENIPNDALAAMEAGLKLAPTDPVAQRELADLYNASGNYDKAETVYRSLLQNLPNDAAAHSGLGSVLLHLKRPTEAQNELLTAVKLDPKLGEAYGSLAMAASENKEYTLAIRALDERARYLPEVPGTWFLRATAYDSLRDYIHAAEYYRKFLAEANGKFPDQEWKARHRLIAIVPENKR